MSIPPSWHELPPEKNSLQYTISDDFFEYAVNYSLAPPHDTIFYRFAGEFEQGIDPTYCPPGFSIPPGAWTGKMYTSPYARPTLKEELNDFRSALTEFLAIFPSKDIQKKLVQSLAKNTETAFQYILLHEKENSFVRYYDIHLYEVRLGALVGITRNMTSDHAEFSRVLSDFIPRSTHGKTLGEILKGEYKKIDDFVPAHFYEQLVRAYESGRRMHSGLNSTERDAYRRYLELLLVPVEMWGGKAAAQAASVKSEQQLPPLSIPMLKPVVRGLKRDRFDASG